MATTASHAYKSYLYYGAAAGSETTKVAQVDNIGGLQLTAEEIDVTNHDSPDTMNESIPGMMEGGEVTLSIVFAYADISGASGFNTLYNTVGVRTTKYWKITIPDSTGTAAYKWTFAGWVKSLGTDALGTKDGVKAMMTIKVNSKPAFATV